MSLSMFWVGSTARRKQIHTLFNVHTRLLWFLCAYACVRWWLAQIEWEGKKIITSHKCDQCVDAKLCHAVRFVNTILLTECSRQSNSKCLEKTISTYTTNKLYVWAHHPREETNSMALTWSRSRLHYQSIDFSKPFVLMKCDMSYQRNTCIQRMVGY